MIFLIIFLLSFVFSLLSKKEKKHEGKAEKQRIYRKNSTKRPIQTSGMFLFLPFIGTVSNDVAAPKPEKEQRIRQKKSNLKV